MARTRNPVSEPSYDLESDSDVPEEVGASQAKTRVQASEAALRSFEEGERAKRKEKNRKKDEALKARASKKVAAVDEEEEEEKEEERLMLEDRMRRAMEDAEESVAGSEDERGFMELMGDDIDDEEELENGDGDRGSQDDEEAMDTDSANADEFSAPPSTSRLPDHLFAALGQGSNTPTPSSSIKIAKKNLEEVTKPARKRRRNKQKDVIVGTRTIRTMTSSSAYAVNTAARYTVPAARVSRFTDFALGLRKEKPSKEKWKAKLVQKRGSKHAERNSRMAANVGVFRSSGGPAACFVRAH